MTDASQATWGFRIRPREWIRLAPRLREDPDDVALGARAFFALGGHDEGPTHRRFLRTEAGRRLVREATPYPPRLTDWEALRALPDGTLGREYVRELAERGIDPVELSRITDTVYEGMRFSAEHAYVRDRVRHAHDLFHTLTGHGTDAIGEAGVLAFTFGQTGNKGWAMLVLLSVLTQALHRRFDGWGVVWRAFRRGRRARFLPAVEDWDRLLRRPIDEARAELGVVPAEPYTPMTTDGIFGGGPRSAAA